MKQKDEHILYFAYGSNLDVAQMNRRCPDAKVIGPAYLKGYRLGFRGNSTGVGYCTITKAKGHEVPGGLWSINESDLKALDRYEGYPKLYTRFEVTVTTDKGERQKAITYAMLPKCKPALPADFYIRTCLRGYKDFGLNPEMFLKALNYTQYTITNLLKNGEKLPEIKPRCRECGKRIPEYEWETWYNMGTCLNCLLEPNKKGEI